MSQAPGRPPRPPVDDTDIKVRNRRMLLVGAVMAALAFVVAAGYWYTHQPGKAAPPPTAMSIARHNGDLVLGPATARHHLTVTMTFDCRRCVTFEAATWQFVRDDAAAGLVQVRYVIPRGSSAQYDAAIKQSASRALVILDDLVSNATVMNGRDVLKVILDGKPLTQADPLDLANALESALAQ